MLLTPEEEAAKDGLSGEGWQMQENSKRKMAKKH
jgi:hypothetical protein